MKAYSVNIIGLSLNAHLFEFDLDNGFFAHYGTELVAGGNFQAKVTLNKHETFIETDFSIEGKADLLCDRTLEPFQFPVKVRKKVLFKYGEVPGEVDDEVVIIAREQTSLELGQLMYELIALQIPMKKLHPRLQALEEDSDEEGKIVYTSGEPNTTDEDPIDPRWEILKKLNKQ